MIKYPKRPLFTALVCGGILMATGTAQAVNVSADGRGEVLLYPYYTTRSDFAGNAYATLLSVVNATALAKAVRVRFMEGKNSREVMGFNLFLSPFDVWTAAVLPDASTGGAKIGTLDLSCTLPPSSASPTAPFASFVNFGYSGANDDGAGTTLDRAKEGYFEIIEMATYSSTSITGKAVTHVNGVPPCGANVNDTQAAGDAQPTSGGLFGTTTFINVNSGTDYTADAVALANFHQVGSNYQGTGASLPNLTQATPPVSSIQAPNGALYESLWSMGTADPVSAVLMHDSVMNEFVLDTATESATDWVVTMPTKRFYVINGTGNAPRLFQSNFNGNEGSCDDISYGVSDREERRNLSCGYPGGVCFLPPPGYFRALCSAANVIAFNGNSAVLGAILKDTSIVVGFQNGWLDLRFRIDIGGLTPANVHKLINIGATSISGRGQATTTGNTTTYIGLPVIGFAVSSFTNGTLIVGSQKVLSNYGGSFVHKTSTTIQ